MDKCDRCDKPSEIHEIDAQKNVEIHLCRECAIAAGYIIPETPPVTELLTQFATAKSAEASAPQSKTAVRSGARTACETCHTTFARFRKTGLVGCPDCYEAFARQLEQLVSRAQAGGASHIGRVPKRSAHAVDRQVLRRQLVEELDRAVAAEQYERAAKLRDQLSSLATGSHESAE
ncbi:MAG: UvrB/UvrC motif-containing protein [Phycisphaerales bacterium]|nr:UvrB/UvrC motif-containing protein [Phycisphaerales bacterium]